MQFLEEISSEGLEIARNITKEGPICDHCLGRQFAQISHGLSNEQRGMILKAALRASGEALGEGTCWVCNGLFEHLEYWISTALEKLTEYEFNSFLVGTKVSGLLLQNEELLWEIAGALYAEPLKAELNREVGKRLEHETGKRVEFETPDIVVILNLWTETVELQIKPVFIYGRYLKLTRGISQTRWFCRECGGKGCERCNFTGMMYPESVEGLISGPLLEEFNGEDLVLHGCGREDIDARMLGSGRPFVVEIKEPKRRQVDLQRAAEQVNEANRGKVEVRELQYVGREMVAKLKDAQMDKLYRVEVEFRSPVRETDLKKALDRLNGALIEQQTPTRVLHRRADLVRNRNVYSVQLVSFDGKQAALQLTCRSNAFFKELISGDEGRTRPSLSALLGTPAEVRVLDVLDVKVGIHGEDAADREDVC
ncbi:MAG: tRNA pseudouridine(54/55) synthase Pus10 [Methanophagales archaeon ANME-1-THS]|nr:MAG: tRNA pseudouridine(54/55) synthase Pus10 [Methanophagales archaeon ANME-1-THS]